MRWALLAIELVVCGNAIGGGWYGLAGARVVPRDWLDGTPFRDYRVPSLVLLVAVGGSMAVAAALALAAWPRAGAWAAAGAGVVLLGWIAAQVALIGYRSFLQPLMAAAALATIGLAAATLA
ncbi:MAG: hypothetical protein R3C15_13455 [Thermoleophilia bacterium]